MCCDGVWDVLENQAVPEQLSLSHTHSRILSLARSVFIAVYRSPSFLSFVAALAPASTPPRPPRPCASHIHQTYTHSLTRLGAAGGGIRRQAFEGGSELYPPGLPFHLTQQGLSCMACAGLPCEAVAEKLAQHALDMGSGDNISVIVAKV